MIREGALFGTLCAASSERQNVSPATLSVVGLFARIIGHQINRERMFEELVDNNGRLLKSAYIDPLTSVANRRALEERLSAMLSAATLSRAPVTVAFIDLDGFKAINDQYGHDSGDRVLIEIAMRLLKTLRRDDLVARYGGDEFVVAAPGAQTDDLRQRIEERASGSFALGSCTISYAGPSVGVVLSEPDERDAEQLLARADKAM